MSSTAISVETDDSRKQKDTFAIIVNGETSLVHDEKVTYEEAVRIAYASDPAPDTTYTVTFGNAKGRRKEGELVPGQSVTVKKKGTEFDVTPTGKS